MSYKEQAENYALAKMANSPNAGCIDLRAPSLQEQMTDKLTRLEAQVKETKELLSLLSKNPEFERMISLLGRGGLY